MRFGCGSDVARIWCRRSAEVKGKRFPVCWIEQEAVFAGELATVHEVIRAQKLGARKDPQSLSKIRANSSKEFSEQFEGGCRSLSSKARVFDGTNIEAPKGHPSKGHRKRSKILKKF